MLRYFAIVSGRTGYALDYYPEERRRYERECRKSIVGDFASYEEAWSAAAHELQTRCEAANGGCGNERSRA